MDSAFDSVAAELLYDVPADISPLFEQYEDAPPEAANEPFDDTRENLYTNPA